MTDNLEIRRINNGVNEGLVGVYVGRIAYELDRYTDEVNEVEGFILITGEDNVEGYKLHVLNRDDIWDSENIYEELWKENKDKVSEFRKLKDVYDKKQEEYENLYRKDEDGVYYPDIETNKLLHGILKELKYLRAEVSK